MRTTPLARDPSNHSKSIPITKTGTNQSCPPFLPFPSPTQTRHPPLHSLPFLVITLLPLGGSWPDPYATCATPQQSQGIGVRINDGATNDGLGGLVSVGVYVLPMMNLVQRELGGPC
ncbi:hypothetical protein TNCT_38841 [Trichonephila clavata]|uniref:Uncharacterized protein n=1 Tax=Trichonephila clavata TaxID=2740835 RepID=A0A8X6L043_TRICU|nr:hypothetical protein TNCT_38841 [Trichonephila clavata]